MPYAIQNSLNDNQAGKIVFNKNSNRVFTQGDDTSLSPYSWMSMAKTLPIKIISCLLIFIRQKGLAINLYLCISKLVKLQVVFNTILIKPYQNLL